MQIFLCNGLHLIQTKEKGNGKLKQFRAGIHEALAQGISAMGRRLVWLQQTESIQLGINPVVQLCVACRHKRKGPMGIFQIDFHHPAFKRRTIDNDLILTAGFYIGRLLQGFCSGNGLCLAPERLQVVKISGASYYTDLFRQGFKIRSKGMASSTILSLMRLCLPHQLERQPGGASSIRRITICPDLVSVRLGYGRAADNHFHRISQSGFFNGIDGSFHAGHGGCQ